MSNGWQSTKRKAASWRYPILSFLGGAAGIFLGSVGWHSWVLVPLGIILLGLAVVTGILKEKAEKKDTERDVRRLSMRTQDQESARAPIAKDLELKAWGVHTSLVSTPYLPRDAEAEVVEAIVKCPVLIVGSSMSGKTRMAVEVIKANHPDKPVLIPDPPDGVATIINAGEKPKHHVIWLDDLERYLQDPNNLKTRWIEDLQENGNIVIATMRANQYEMFMPNENDPRTQWETLQRFHKIYLSDELSERQRLAARSSPSFSAGILKYGLGTYLGGGYLAAERLRIGRATNPIGWALTLAAMDWQRTGISETISPTTARNLISTYLGIAESQILTEEGMNAGFEWATAKTIGGQFGLLEYSPNGNLRPFDYLLDPRSYDKPVERQVWIVASQFDAPAGQLTTVGVNAEQAGHEDVARTFFERAARLGDPDGMLNYAIHLDRQDRTAEANAWDTKAAAAGLPRALTALAVRILREGGDDNQAEPLLRKAAEAGDGSAMTNLGVLLMRIGKTDEGIEWHRRAAEAGSSLGMTNYGLQLELRGELDAAENWYRKAANAGDAAGAALYQLACLAAKRGEVDEAKGLLHESARRRNPAGMAQLGLILEAEGEVQAANDLFQGAADRGGAVGLAMVGRRLSAEGKHNEAESLLKRAIADGLSQAVTELAINYASSGRAQEAKEQYEIAVAAGDGRALTNLGELLLDEGKTREAETLFRDAANRGWPAGMYLLSKLLTHVGGRESSREAATYLAKAADLGNLQALFELGSREVTQGNRSKALDLLEKAAEGGHQGAVERLATLQSE